MSKMAKEAATKKVGLLTAREVGTPKWRVRSAEGVRFAFSTLPLPGH